MAYKQNKYKSMFYRFLCIGLISKDKIITSLLIFLFHSKKKISLVSVGIFFLICRWFIKLKLWMMMDKSNFKDCSHLFIIPRDKENSVNKIVEILFSGDGKESFRYFVYRQLRYIWNGNAFTPTSFDINLSFEKIHSGFAKGHSNSSYQSNLEKFGDNMMKVPVKSYLYLTLNELSNPFYVFQLFSVCLWIFEGYVGN